MNEDIKAVANRIKGLREIMNVSIKECADVCGVSEDVFASYETGDVDIPVGVLQSLAKKYEIDLGTLISGKEPRMHSYYLTKKDKGLKVERRKDYKYEALASGYIGRKADPFIVIAPYDDKSEPHFNSHPGQEFIYIIKGKMNVIIEDKEIIVEEGDSILFDGTKKHAVVALDKKECKFLDLII